MKLLINYASKNFRKQQRFNSASGLKEGLFDKVISYSPRDIEQEFLKKNKKILNQERGSGYWLWKPYFIKKILDSLSYGDFLFYCDSGSYFIRPINPLIDIMIKDGLELMVFGLTDKEKIWTKRDAFVLMNCDSTKYSETNQRLSGFSLSKKSSFAINFINEFLYFAQDERIITDIENQCGYPNYPGFTEHRHDQSIFSLLTKKYDLPAYRDPSQWGNGVKQYYANSNYDQIIEHTRERRFSLLSRIKGKIESIINISG
jgi:hypothetical protein